MHVHIYRGANVRYLARVRAAGRRKYEVIGKPTKSRQASFRRLADAMACNSLWKRGDVLMTADYYDPVVVAEMRR